MTLLKNVISIMTILQESYDFTKLSRAKRSTIICNTTDCLIKYIMLI